jgi:hypothetical protein
VSPNSVRLADLQRSIDRANNEEELEKSAVKVRKKLIHHGILITHPEQNDVLISAVKKAITNELLALVEELDPQEVLRKSSRKKP